MALVLLEEVSPSPKVIRSPLLSEKGVRLVRAREKGVELGENTSVGTRRDRKVDAGRLIRVVGLRVAEPLVLYNYEGGAECESNKYRQDYISQID